MRNLGFIPVRGGSKRLPRKNLMQLGEHSITHRTIQTAIEADVFDKIILSTDDDEIVEHCQIFENQLIIEKRDPSLASDTATVLQVVIDLMQRMTNHSETYDTFTIMLATCPFRKAQHIKEGFTLMEKDVDSVISVTEYDFPWEMSLLLDENSQNKMTPALQPSALLTGNTRSQDRKKVYHPNGAFYIGRWNTILRDKNFFKGNMRGYPMSEHHSFDIDEARDMQIARFLVEKGLI